MALFGRRREKPPAEVLDGLDPDERVLSWADTATGAAVVVTPLGLWWPDPTGRRRIPWDRIDRVVWQNDILSVTEADVVDDDFLRDRPAVHARLTVPRDLPPTVRARVERNIVRSELLTVAGGTVRFVGRRPPGADGVQWFARFEPGTPDTAPTRSAVRARLELLRAERV